MDTRIGAPITTEQAVRAVLRLIDSPIMLNIETAKVRTVLTHAKEACYDHLSNGEQTLVDIAASLWNGAASGAKINALGSLDKDNRRKVLLILWYRYMGHDVPLNEFDEATFVHLFGDPAERMENR